MQRDCLILFRSLTYAQRAVHILERGGITATIRRVPQGLTDRGCTYAVRVRSQRLSQALTLLSRQNLPHGKVFATEADGSYTEVRP